MLSDLLKDSVFGKWLVSYYQSSLKGGNSVEYKMALFLYIYISPKYCSKFEKTNIISSS